MKYTKWFLASSLLCSTAIIADQTTPSNEVNGTEKFRSGDILPNDKYTPAYNAYAGIEVEKDSSFPDMSITASFLYYYANQGGMSLATSAATQYGGSSPQTVNTSNSIVLNQDLAFKPGFKVGLGFGCDESFFSAEYTWIRQTTHTNENAPNPGSEFSAGTTGSWVVSNWFQQIATASSQSLSATNVNSQWKLGLDIGDLLINRAFYQGKDVIVTPFVGLRGAWIRQNINVTITPPSGIFTGLSYPTITSENSSNSWAIGPRVGLDASYLLGMGFRLEGSTAGSLLATQYTHVRHQENIATIGNTPSTIGTEINNYNCVRPEVDLGLGLGWGKYLSEGRFYFDLSANYDFIAFFEQNMIRNLLDQSVAGVGSSASNLYFQGLNITARFDF